MEEKNQRIIKVVRELLLSEPTYQYPDRTAQFVWRAWEKLLGKEFYTITQEGFVDMWRLAGTETLLRARRYVLNEIKNKKADEQRHKMAEEYRKIYSK